MQNQEEIKQLQAKLEELQSQKNKAIKNEEYGYAVLLRDRVKALSEKINQLSPPIDIRYNELLNNISAIYDNTPIYELKKAIYISNVLIAEYTVSSGANFLVKGVELSTLVQFAIKKVNQKKEHLRIISEHLAEWITVMEEMPLDDFKEDAIEIKIKNSIEFMFNQPLRVVVLDTSI